MTWRVFKCLFRGYAIICTILVTLIIFVSIYSRIYVHLLKAELPNGTYLNRVNLFSDYDDVVLRHPSGRILVPPSIDFVCFNAVYVMVWRFGPAHRSRQFIYRKGDDEAVFDVAQFKQMRKESGLCEQRGSRPADEAEWTGYGILVKDKRYRRAWYE